MIELLISELKDPYIRENFRRIKKILSDIERKTGSGSVGDNIINIVGSSIWDKLSKTVPASSIKTLDTLDIDDFNSAKYIISVRDEVNNKTSTLEINIKNENGSLSDTIFAKISGGISFSLNANYNAGNLELDLTNNETVELEVVMARLLL